MPMTDTTFHFEANFVSHPHSSALKASTYLSGQPRSNPATGEVYRYSRSERVLYDAMVLPDGAPPEFADPQTAWASLEAACPQTDAQVAHRIHASMPRGLPFASQLAYALSYASYFAQQGLVVEVAIHEDDHVHLLAANRGLRKAAAYDPERPEKVWGPKTKPAYLCRDGFGGEGYLTAEQFAYAKAAGAAKVFKWKSGRSRSEMTMAEAEAAEGDWKRIGRNPVQRTVPSLAVLDFARRSEIMDEWRGAWAELWRKAERGELPKLNVDEDTALERVREFAEQIEIGARTVAAERRAERERLAADPYAPIRHEWWTRASSPEEIAEIKQRNARIDEANEYIAMVAVLAAQVRERIAGLLRELRDAIAEAVSTVLAGVREARRGRAEEAERMIASARTPLHVAESEPSRAAEPEPEREPVIERGPEIEMLVRRVGSAEVLPAPSLAPRSADERRMLADPQVREWARYGIERLGRVYVADDGLPWDEAMVDLAEEQMAANGEVELAGGMPVERTGIWREAEAAPDVRRDPEPFARSYTLDDIIGTARAAASAAHDRSRDSRLGDVGELWVR